MFIPTSKKKWETKVKKGKRKKERKTSAINTYIINIKQNCGKGNHEFTKYMDTSIRIFVLFMSDVKIS